MTSIGVREKNITAFVEADLRTMYNEKQRVEIQLRKEYRLFSKRLGISTTVFFSIEKADAVFHCVFCLACSCQILG